MRKIRYGQRKLSDEQREQTERDWADAVAEAIAHPELRDERHELARSAAQRAFDDDRPWLASA